MGSTTDEESADEEIKTCATCRRDGEQPCTGCHGAPDSEGRQMYTTYYCSAGCQKTDYYDTHKYACKAAKDRRALYRAGDIAQLAFYAYSERLFDVPITKVDKQGETLYLQQGRNDQNLILPFPGKLFSNKDDKLAALTVLTCGNALGFVHVIMENMFGKLIQRMVRVDHTPKGFKRRVILISPLGDQADNATQNHAMIQCTFENGEQFAIDITAVQHGHAKPVIPWQLYSKSRVKKFKAVALLKSIKDCSKHVGKAKSEGKATKSKAEEFAEVFGGAVEQWQARNGSVYDMLQSRDVLYERKKAMLLEFIDKRVKKHKEHMQNNGRLNH